MEECKLTLETDFDFRITVRCWTHDWDSEGVSAPNEVYAAEHKHKQEVADGG